MPKQTSSQSDQSDLGPRERYIRKLMRVKVDTVRIVLNDAHRENARICEGALWGIYGLAALIAIAGVVDAPPYLVFCILALGLVSFYAILGIANLKDTTQHQIAVDKLKDDPTYIDHREAAKNESWPSSEEI